MNKQSITLAIRNLRTSLKKHSPEILTGIGIAGMITTTVMAVRATPKALMLMEEKKEELKTNELNVKEIIIVTWKCYVPAVAIGAVSVVCLIGANSVNMRRRAALATAYSLSESALKEYQEKVVETIGEKKEESIRDSIANDKIKQNPVATQEVIITEKGNVLCFDVISGRYFKSDIEKIRKAINDLNQRMRDEMYITLNDYYYEIGLERISIGDDLGWNIDTGYITPQFSSQLTEDGTPCLVIGYLVEPRYDYFGN